MVGIFVNINVGDPNQMHKILAPLGIGCKGMLSFLIKWSKQFLKRKHWTKINAHTVETKAVEMQEPKHENS